MDSDISPSELVSRRGFLAAILVLFSGCLGGGEEGDEAIDGPTVESSYHVEVWWHNNNKMMGERPPVHSYDESVFDDWEEVRDAIDEAEQEIQQNPGQSVEIEKDFTKEFREDEVSQKQDFWRNNSRIYIEHEGNIYYVSFYFE